MGFLRKLKGWRTMIFNVVSLLVLVAGSQQMQNIVDADTLAYVVVIGNAVLRMMTTTPVGTGTPQ